MRGYYYRWGRRVIQRICFVATKEVLIDILLVGAAILAGLLFGVLNQDTWRGLLGGFATFGIFFIGVLLWAALRAPYELDAERENTWQAEKQRADELEEACKPKLTITASRREHPAQKTASLVLELANLGTDPVRNCYVRIKRLDWDMGDAPSGREKIYHDRLEGRDHYLRWDGQGLDKYRTFQSQAHIEVVSGSGGYSNYAVASLHPLGLSITTGWHYLEVEVGGDNIPTQTVLYRFRIGSFVQSWNDIPPPGLPPTVDVEEVDIIPAGVYPLS